MPSVWWSLRGILCWFSSSDSNGVTPRKDLSRSVRASLSLVNVAEYREGKREHLLGVGPWDLNSCAAQDNTDSLQLLHVSGTSLMGEN